MTLDRPVHRGKVGVVTVIDHANYGNRLQNYAMQRIITGFGFSCTTIVNHPKDLAESRIGRAQAAPSSLTARLTRRAARLGRRLFRRRAERERLEARRLRSVKETRGQAFTRAYIRETDFTLYRDTPAAHLDAMYDYFVAGSDQVWNPNFRGLSEVDFLTFASGPKRIAFSASMGVADIPDEFRAFYRERLSAFEHISVREAAAAGVVRTLTGREVPVTIDPTLMLRKADWSALAKRHPQRPANGYVLTYFLGPRPEGCQGLIDRCAARLGLRVVHLNDPAAPEFYAADPGEFLGLIGDARLHLTDSFHGAVFSVIFGTPFVSFARASRQASMGSRLDTLLGTLRLEHRRFREGMSNAELDRLLEPDFSHVRPILEMKTAEALAYLARALGQQQALPADLTESAVPA